MQLRLERVHSDKDDSLGLLYVDGEVFSFVVEDPYHVKKIAGETRIPAGTYKIEKTYSPKFGKPMWELLNVPGYTGIRIHTGNTPADTEGCIMPGFGAYIDHFGPSRISDSTKAYNILDAAMDKAAADGENITIMIVDNDQFEVVNLD